MASYTTYGNYVSFDGSISLHENSAFHLAVPQLCRVRSRALPDALEEWMHLSPAAAQTGLGWIRNLF